MLPALHVARHAPKTEALLEQRLQFRQALIADRKVLRFVGPNPAMMERRKIVASKVCKYSGVAGSWEGHAVEMIVTENKRRQCAQGNTHGLGVFRSDASQLRGSDPLQFLRIEGRILDDISHQIH